MQFSSFYDILLHLFCILCLLHKRTAVSCVKRYVAHLIYENLADIVQTMKLEMVQNNGMYDENPDTINKALSLYLSIVQSLLNIIGNTST